MVTPGIPVSLVLVLFVILSLFLTFSFFLRFVALFFLNEVDEGKGKREETRRARADKTDEDTATVRKRRDWTSKRAGIGTPLGSSTRLWPMAGQDQPLAKIGRGGPPDR